MLEVLSNSISSGNYIYYGLSRFIFHLSPMVRGMYARTAGRQDAGGAGRKDIADVDFHSGTSEYAEADDKTGLAFGVVHNIALKSLELSAGYFHEVAHFIRQGFEIYRLVSALYVAAEVLYLVMWNCGYEVVAVLSEACVVDHEMLDIWVFHNL